MINLVSKGCYRAFICSSYNIICTLYPQGLKARGNVEDWLGKVEEAMFMSLRKAVRVAMVDFEAKARELWVLDHASQVGVMTAKYGHIAFHVSVITMLFESICYSSLSFCSLAE